DYVHLAQQFNLPEAQAGEPAPQLEKGMTPPLALYPGSPSIARMLMRPGDSMRLFELHSSDARTLAAHFGGRHVQVLNEDGFAGLKGQVPPNPRRALVLMDPSYELVGDYGKVVASMRDAVQRFPE